MIKIENTEVIGLEHAIRGMRNPLNSWDRSDSVKKHSIFSKKEEFKVGQNDLELMKKLADNGSTHAKYRRMIVVYADVTAPLYWWKEYDTYKVGTVTNSCSTMHTIHKKEFELDDFSHEQLNIAGQNVLVEIIKSLNSERLNYIRTKDKQSWYSMIQLLPSSYNQKRTIMVNYEVLSKIYKDRKDHKLDEWHDFCDWIEKLEYSEVII